MLRTLQRRVKNVAPSCSPLPALNPGDAIEFQSFLLYSWLTVAENIGGALLARGMKPADVRAPVEKVVHLVGLTGFEDAYPRELSGGMKQRVGTARALAVEPEILPSTGMQPALACPPGDDAASPPFAPPRPSPPPPPLPPASALVIGSSVRLARSPLPPRLRDLPRHPRTWGGLLPSPPAGGVDHRINGCIARDDQCDRARADESDVACVDIEEREHQHAHLADLLVLDPGDHSCPAVRVIDPPTSPVSVLNTFGGASVFGSLTWS